uniref:SMP domain-containing protein n=1 Tax=Oryza meridionalis TaxID=40149 RepID=A0A0E0FB86_9ORYZ
MSATGLFFLSRVIPGCRRGEYEAPPNDDGEKINKATTLKDMVGGVVEVLPANKLATREDADKVAVAAAQNNRRHTSGGRELTRSIQSRPESIRNPIPHRADVFFFSAGKRSPMVETKCVRECILQSPGQSGTGQESRYCSFLKTFTWVPRAYIELRVYYSYFAFLLHASTLSAAWVEAETTLSFPIFLSVSLLPRSPSRFPSILLLTLLSTGDALPLRHSTSLSPITSLLNNESGRRPSRFFSHPPRISQERAPRVDKRILIHSPPPLTRPSLSLSVTPSHPRPHPSRLSPVSSRGGGSDGVNCSRGPDPTVAVASAAPAGESGGAGGGVVSGRRIRWRLFRRVDPAVLYPLVLTLRTQACPAAVASALPRADLAEVPRRRFRWADLAVLHTLPLRPKLLPRIRRRRWRRQLLPWIRWRQRRRRRRRWWHPLADSADGNCLTLPTSPWPDPPLLLVVYLLFVYVMMMSLL